MKAGAAMVALTARAREMRLEDLRAQRETPIFWALRAERHSRRVEAALAVWARSEEEP